MAYARVAIYVVVFLTAEWLWRDVCIISIHRWMQTVTSPTLTSSEGDGSVGAAVYKRHSAVCAHVIIVYGVILVRR